MWVDSKTAAAVLGVKYDALQKATRRSEKSGKKFCTIKFHKLYFEYINGRGGSSGKVLQIWLDEQSENKLISKGCNIEDISDTRTSRAFAKQGLCCDPVSAQWQGEYKSSKDRQEDTTKKTSLEQKSSEGSINDEKNKANLEEIRNPHISSGKHNNADDSVDEFQSYAIAKEQKASHSLEELYEDMNINDDKKADAFLKAKVVKLWLKARDRKVKIDAFLQYININNMYGKRVSKGQILRLG
ncbi:hypothetical protein IXZ24_06870 [Campylobacter fetus subsp. venerealis bv. intermedius]|uniref:hypothetical protein n=1 Tax=Campylobacter fetus TaxID=196 RepID=UPI0026DFD0DD|nr:hypothetical protein [Campylobacter fetus]WKW26291.1 hypothetical protein IXZ24_06870 [Campylobacter fetus subsp. venerealis bv. intermedius]